MINATKFSKGEYVWQSVVFWSVIFTVIEVTFSILYKTEIKTWQLWADFLISSIFVADIFYQVRNKIKESDLKNASWQWKVGILVDVAASIPFDIIAYYSGARAGIQILNLIRLLRLVRITKLIYLLGDYTIVPKSIKAQFIGGGVATIVHFMALIWSYLHPQVIGESIATNYITSLYWVITTLTTIGYGDIIPTGNIDRLYCMGVMIIGVGVYGIIIGNVARILTQADRHKEKTKEKMQDLNLFMKHYNIPDRIQQSSFSYYRHLYKKRLTNNDIQIIAELPHALQSEIKTYMNMKLISTVNVFRTCSHSCLKVVASKLEQMYFSPGQTIINIGEKGDEMYIIAHGAVDVILKDGSTVATLHEGQIFGEVALLQETMRNANIRSQNYCDLYKLKKSDFLEIIDQHPELLESMQQITNRRSTDRTPLKVAAGQ